MTLSATIKARIWHFLERCVPFLPERLRLLILMQPLILPLGYQDIKLIVDSDREYYGRRSPKGEPETVRWVEESMGASSVFYDIGANVGVYSLIAARRHPGIQIVAFEPAGPNYGILVANMALNKVAVPLLPIALGGRTRIDAFAYSTLRSGGARHQLGGRTDYVFQHPVIAYRLDELIQTFHLPPPTHLKIDVDGTERDILRGAERTLGNVRSMIVEINRDPGDLLGWLEQRGFKVVLRGSEHQAKHNANYWLERQQMSRAQPEI